MLDGKECNLSMRMGKRKDHQLKILRKEIYFEYEILFIYYKNSAMVLIPSVIEKTK